MSQPTEASWEVEEVSPKPEDLQRLEAEFARSCPSGLPTGSEPSDHLPLVALLKLRTTANFTSGSEEGDG